jgi:peptidyl-prolyl cis-trans isomerase D
MLQTIREKAQGPVLTIIVVAICLMFAATGVESILGSSNNQNVAKVNGEKVTDQELQEAIFLKKRQLISQMGENIDPKKLEDKNLKEPALDDLIKRKLLLQVANENNMIVSDKQVSRLIVNNADFHQDGKFSEETFQTIMARAGLSVSLYKRLYSTDELLQQFTSGIVDTGFLTDKEMDVDARFSHQKRDVKHIVLSLNDEMVKTSVGGDEVKSYYASHEADFKSEESAHVEYIQLDQSAFEKPVSDEEVQEVYQQEVANFNSSEQREVSHILIEVNKATNKTQAQQKIAELQAQIKSGKDFADIARASSDDMGSKESGGLLGTLNEEAFPKEFVAAAKLLKTGEVSNVVETSAGLHLIKVNNVFTPKAPGFDERKDAIRAELSKSKAAPLFQQAVEQLKDLAFNSADLAEPASALKVSTKITNDITRNKGVDIFASKKVRKAVFEDRVLLNGENSDVIEVMPTTVVVLRVKEHKPSALLPFESVSVKAEQSVKATKAKEALKKKSEAIVASIKSGEPIEIVAKNYGYSVNTQLQAKRAGFGGDLETMEAAFALPSVTGNQSALDTIEKINGDRVVIVTSNVQDGTLSDLSPMERNAMKRYVSRAQAIQEFTAYQDSIKENAKIDILIK